MNRLAVIALVLPGFVLAGCGADNRPRDVGDVAEIGGLRLSVTKVVVGGDDEGPWFQVWMRMKNISDHGVPIPTAAIACRGNDALGYLAPVPDRNYAIKPGAAIFVRSSAAGVMRLLAPGDTRNGERPRCHTPAHVRISTGSDTIQVRIPDSVVEGLNDY